MAKSGEVAGGSGCVAGRAALGSALPSLPRPSRQGHPLMARVRLHRLCLHLNPSSSLPLPNTVPQPAINSGPFLRARRPHPLSRPTPQPAQPHLVCGECDSRVGGAGRGCDKPTSAEYETRSLPVEWIREEGGALGRARKGYTSRTTREFYWCSSAQQRVARSLRGKKSPTSFKVKELRAKCAELRGLDQTSDLVARGGMALPLPLPLRSLCFRFDDTRFKKGAPRAAPGQRGRRHPFLFPYSTRLVAKAEQAQRGALGAEPSPLAAPRAVAP